MNQNQKTIILISLAILLGVGLFLPYDGVEINTINNKPSEKLFMGYFTVFDPPSKRDMVKSFLKLKQPKSYWKDDPYSKKGPYLEKMTDDRLNELRYETYESNISFSRLIAEIFILLIITTALVLIFSNSKHKHGAPQ